MITVEQCAKFAGLASYEVVLGATPSAKHRCSFQLRPESMARSENRPQNDRRRHPFVA